MGKLKIVVSSLIAASIISACGGGSSSGGFTGSGTGDVGAIQSITISYPVSNAITDNQNGTYSRKGSVLVRDVNGNPAAEGTKIDLSVIDTVIATGTLGGGDAISGSTVTIPNATYADSSAIADLTTASITRTGVSGGGVRTIDANDLVLLTNGGDSRDAVRKVQADPTLASSLSVSSAYNRSYPSYATPDYVIGGSMLGVGIAGEDKNGNRTPGEVQVVGTEGIATFYITYASSLSYINTGFAPSRDTRVSPVGSADVYVVASAGGITAVSDDFYFAPIAGFTVTPTFTAITTSLASTNITNTVCVEDGGDAVRVPFWDASVVKSDGDLSLVGLQLFEIGTTYTAASYTNSSGCIGVLVSSIAGAADDDATITVSIGDGTASFTITGK
jgi:hypothetical protein